MQKIARDLTTGSITKNILHLALPLITANILMDIFNIVDMIFVGRLGPSAIAAVSISGILMGLIRMLAMGISTGTVAIISRCVGEGKRHEAKDVMTQSVLLAIFFSVIMAVVGLFFTRPILGAIGADEDVIEQGTAYFSIFCVFGFTMVIQMTLSAGLRGFGNAILPMQSVILTSALNLILDPLLIFGIGPFPRLGVAGAAIAAVIARGSAMVMLLWVMITSKSEARVGNLLSGVRWPLMLRIVKIGMWSTLRMASMNFSRLLLVGIVTAFGTASVAAFGIGMRLRLFVIMPGMGFGDAASVLVGQNMGANQPERATKSAWIATSFFATGMTFVAIGFFFFPGLILSVFSDDPAVLAMGADFLRIFAPATLFMTLSTVLGRAMDGAGDTISPMTITTIALIGIGLPLAWWFSRLWGIGGMWISITTTEVIQGAVMALWFIGGHWKKKKV